MNGPRGPRFCFLSLVVAAVGHYAVAYRLYAPFERRALASAASSPLLSLLS